MERTPLTLGDIEYFEIDWHKNYDWIEVNYQIWKPTYCDVLIDNQKIISSKGLQTKGS